MRVLVLLFLFQFTQDVLCQEDIVSYLNDNYKDNPEEIIIYSDSILFNEDVNQELKSKLLYYQAVSYQLTSNNSKALTILNQVKESKNDIEFNIKVLLAKSNSNTLLQNYTISTEQALSALELSKENKYQALKIKALNTLSYIHYSIQEYDKSLFYLNESADLLLLSEDSIELSATYNNMAILQKNSGNFEEAIKYNYKSLEISKLVDDKIGIGKTYSNIGRIYDLLGDKNKALTFYKKSEENNMEYNISNSIPLRNIAALWMSMGEYKKAENKYLEALKIEKSKDNSEVKHRIYKDLFNIALNSNEFEKAIKYQALVDSFSIVNAKLENEENIRNIEGQYKLQANEKKLIQQKKDNNKNKIIFIICFSFLILLTLFLYQKNKNTKLKLSEEKLRLEQKVLRSQMNPHFIFNALSAIQNSLLDNEPIQSASYLSKFAKLIRQNFDFINSRHIYLAEEIDALKNYMDTQQMRFQNKFKYQINIDATIDLNTCQIPPLLLQPFVENSIEHAFKNIDKEGLVIVNVKKKDTFICYEIVDNGKGYDVNKHKDGKEHAIDIFKKRLELINNNDFDTFTIDSNENGTTIKFCLQE